MKPGDNSRIQLTINHYQLQHSAASQTRDQSINQKWYQDSIKLITQRVVVRGEKRHHSRARIETEQTKAGKERTKA